MKPIKLLPHHAMRLFEVFYLNGKPEDALSWYDNNQMANNGTSALNQIASNPNQLVQIVDQYDEICRMCPKNHMGDNYQNTSEDTCHDYDTPNPDTAFAEILGIEKICDGTPITSHELKELMEPTYQKFLAEPPFDDNGKKLPLRMMFRDKSENLYMNLFNR